MLKRTELVVGCTISINKTCGLAVNFVATVGLTDRLISNNNKANELKDETLRYLLELISPSRISIIVVSLSRGMLYLDCRKNIHHQYLPLI